MGIFSDRDRRIQQRRSTQSQCEHINSNNSSKCRKQWRHGDRKRDFFSRCTRLLQSKQLHTDDSRSSLSIYPIISRTRAHQPDPHTKSDHYPVGHRYNKRVYPIILCLSQLAIAPATLAESVGGVSATANPIANSSGSVTNQAIQVLQGPYVTNTYGNGVSCQGTTLNMTPYIQFADSRKDPWEDFYNQPQYNMTDVSGTMTPTYVTVQNYPWEDWYDDRTKADGTRWFEDGADITIVQDVDGPNGVPDIIDDDGEMTPTWFKPVRTDMKANQSFNLGLSATLSIPLNRGMQRLCKEAATANVEMQNQLIANKRLDFEIARLKNCGELKKAGIYFHPQSPYASVCADVVVTNPGGQLHPHSHNLPQPNFDSSSDSVTPSPSSSQLSPSSHDSSQTGSQEDLSSNDTHSSSSQLQSNGKGFFQGLRLPWSSPASQQVSQPSGADLLGVWQVGQTTQQQTQSQQ